ncbi:hypothetical protein Tco_0703652 [Tanacetum coccineum]|uniref:Uncharacterized protein n=1 Tax=Tanacetum coccineum TaxID=301880 RepID=A0ABQ4XZY3_9ASTR
MAATIAIPTTPLPSPSSSSSRHHHSTFVPITTAAPPSSSSSRPTAEIDTTRANIKMEMVMPYSSEIGYSLPQWSCSKQQRTYYKASRFKIMKAQELKTIGLPPQTPIYMILPLKDIKVSYQG